MSVLFGIDYTTPYLNMIALKRNGVRFVCRYLAPNATVYRWKRLTRGECAALKLAGIDLVTVYETSAGRALSGYSAGQTDAHAAEAHLAQVKASPDAPVYFAVDFDAREIQQPALNNYFRGIASVIPKERVGAYGGYWVVRRLFDAGLISYGWQTYAWSGGQLDRRAHIYQYKNGQRLAGLSVDYDHALKDDYGQHRRPDDPKNPPWWNRYGPKNKPAWFFKALQEYQRRLKRGEAG